MTIKDIEPHSISRDEPIPRSLTDTTMKRSEEVARRLQHAVLTNGWPIGEVLGTETELMETFKASRATLREAISILSSYGIVAMRPGPGGGLVVRAQAAEAVSRGAAVYLDFANVSAHELYEARECLELLSLELISHRLDESLIRELRDLWKQEDDATDLTSARRMHARLSELSGNTGLQLLTSVIWSVLEGRLMPELEHTLTREHEFMQEVSTSHSRLLAALIEGDVASAQTTMKAHLLANRKRLHPRARLTGAESSRQSSLSSPTRRHLAEMLARDINATLLEGGLKSGDQLGTERDLMEAHNVSRSVLREAIRLLEHHCVVKTQSGPGGGLIVSEPKPDNAADFIALWLPRVGLEPTDIHELRAAIELTAAQLAATRATEHIDGCSEARIVRHQHPEVTNFARCAPAFHIAVAKASRNRALALFVEILVRADIESERMGAASQAKDNKELAVAEHRAILDAISQRDSPLARLRMRKHLNRLYQ